MVSAPGQPWLEFYSIVVPEGLFSPRMARLAPGDALYVEKAPYGFLTLERFAPGGDLWLLASGTGLSAYLSILRDPRSGAPPHHPGARRPYRRRAGLSRGNRKPRPPPGPGQPLRHRSAQTRLPAHRHPRSLGHAARTADHPDRRRPPGAARRPGPETTRVMLCGNPAMLADACKLLGERGFKTGRRGIPVIWPWKTIGDGKVPGDALVRKSSVWHCART